MSKFRMSKRRCRSFACLNEDVEVSQELTDEDFTASLVDNLVAGPQNEEEDAEGDDDEANEPPPKVTGADMRRSLQQLQQ